MASSIPQADSQSTRYRTATVNNRTVFYRQAGDPNSPTIVLLHGLPTSSQMFRELIPALAGKFHLIAPDYIGFGHSDAPSKKDFEYTFDNLAAHVRGLLDQLNLTSYILYMQDYGGPIGFRLFTEKPEQVEGHCQVNRREKLSSPETYRRHRFRSKWWSTAYGCTSASPSATAMSRK
jgi:pimeloyl-ACP methyl ester carboxylesterase